MKTLLRSCLLACVVSVHAESTPAPTKSIVLMGAGELPQGWVQHLADWTRSNLAVKVVSAEPSAKAPESLDAAIESVRPRMKPEWAGAVVIAAPSKPIGAHGVRKPGDSIAAVNVDAMKADGVDASVQLMRLERQVIRAVCMLMDLESSPNPQSAMFAYDSLEQLDQIGRNLDPPWLLQLQRAARARGVALESGNLFNLLD